ncbi:T9SS type B sorting domain-containing protein [Lacinutrix sp. WUR7]|uniref:gliding motility-associated C-terminal domain-containing protein n=1 Tax=Lacinutrix sp. WUR7 TaxID=2653681 RepID=UPI00193D3BAF|nr:gliding motility-associated C-terminal domain-containing protein [Lacinutrix sp. WUR7]QRM88124.1 T9SS type B sorting domain-containing protein [Lacinutrix sp. WUR7]
MNKTLRILIIVTVLFSQSGKSQTAFHNFGNVQIHDEGQIGFHMDLENDGTFNENLGLAGFYNTDNALTISGTEIPKFYEMEVDVIDNLLLEINTEVENSLSYLNGKIITPRLTPSISLDFLNDAIYVLEDNQRHTDGYSSYFGDNEFTFPIGDDNKLRPLITPFQNGSPEFSAAYFNEDPNFPSTFSETFNTSLSEGIINNVNINEFWDFNGTQETPVTLTWNSDSDINALVDDLLNLRVVGWSATENQWTDLGNVDFTGNINTGTITSTSFVPNDYEIITFGSLIGSDGITVYNGISPNGDGKNDVFIIEGVQLFRNTLKIYNRWGRTVYDVENYKNDWNGITNKKVLVGDSKKLPVGTYFYVLNLHDENKEYAGWLYINY